MRILPSLFVLLLAAPFAHADMCKYVDKSGRVTYSNVAVKGAKKEKCFEAPPAPSAAARPPRIAQPPGGFPSVNSETQKKRDDKRREILEQELAAEEKQLEDAKQALAEGEATRLGDERHNYQKFLDRVQALKDTVGLHEKNVAALKEELANVK